MDDTKKMGGQKDRLEKGQPDSVRIEQPSSPSRMRLDRKSLVYMHHTEVTTEGLDRAFLLCVFSVL